jgi:diguanylate cyclase (GGDEF)-like protein/PAS domain S-box-containing protein
MKLIDPPRAIFCFSPAALLAAGAGFALTGVLYVQQSANWAGLCIGVAVTVLIAFYLQLVAVHSRYAAELIAARTAELALSQQMLEYDKSARNFSEQALQLRDRAIELSANAISIYDATMPGFPVCYVNPAFERMSGFRSSDVLGMACCDLHAEQREDSSLPALQVLLARKKSGNVLLQNQKKDGATFWSEMHLAPIENAGGIVTHFIAVQTDVTALRSYQAQLDHTAHYDALTGLANRVLLRDRLEIALQFAARRDQPVWVLYIGLDRFRIINETMGHDVGDAVLKALAARINTCASVTETVSRFGDDEFVLVLEEPQQEETLIQVVDNIMASVAQPITLRDEKFFVGCGIGIAVYPADGRDVETLIKHADSAMHVARQRGSGYFHFYTPQMNQRATERARLETDLRIGIEQQQFILHYQPQVDLRSGRIVGMEALIRWQHPERGCIPPVAFIGLAEETGLIVPIGAWVIRKACAQMKSWQDQGFKDLRISVNISARQFSDEFLASYIASVLDTTGLAPECFQLELTESLVMTDVERGIGILSELKALGVGLSVDDFGTGYSSLAYLKRLPIDVLKIDRSFVSDITESPDDAVIVKSIISLAHSLRLRVVAEGVETAEQLAFLQGNACDEIQGYHFSRPVSDFEFTRILQQQKSLPPYTAVLQMTPPRLVKV